MIRTGCLCFSVAQMLLSACHLPSVPPVALSYQLYATSNGQSTLHDRDMMKLYLYQAEAHGARGKSGFLGLCLNDGVEQYAYIAVQL